MKKQILFFGFAFILIFTACGPAAESRESMHQRAKQVQDSIANSIQTAINEELPMANTATAPAPVAADTTHKK